jgi:hypothetical protein
MSWDEIAATLGVRKQSIHKACRPFEKLLQDPDALKGYQDNKQNLLEATEMTLLSSLVDPDAIKKAGLAARTMAFGTVFDKVRLEKGQTTQNIGTIHAELGTLQVDREALESSLASIEAEIQQLKGQSAQPQEGPVLELPGTDEGEVK